jgi:hypothetical protein
MFKHLTVISYVKKIDPTFENVVFTVDNVSSDNSHKFLRCQAPSELLNAVVNADPPIDVLDIYGHGGPGYFSLGDKTLVDSRPKTWSRLAWLPSKLAKNARVRLLGCLIGSDAAGMIMLKGLSKQLGCEVWGSTTTIYPQDFDENGIKADFVNDWMVPAESITRPIPPRPRFDVGAPDHEALNKWLEFMPRGFEAVRRMPRPALKAELCFNVGEANVAVACGRRLVLVQDSPHKDPLLLQWSRLGCPPLLNQLLLFFQAQRRAFLRARLRSAPRSAVTPGR